MLREYIREMYIDLYFTLFLDCHWVFHNRYLKPKGVNQTRRSKNFWTRRVSKWFKTSWFVNKDQVAYDLGRWCFGVQSISWLETRNNNLPMLACLYLAECAWYIVKSQTSSNIKYQIQYQHISPYRLHRLVTPSKKFKSLTSRANELISQRRKKKLGYPRHVQYLWWSSHPAGIFPVYKPISSKRRCQART